eukprot:IDg11576t1
MVVDFGNDSDGVASTMLYPPATAGLLWGDIPESGDRKGMEAWSNMLTPVESAVDQISVLSLLGGVYHTKLGQYARKALPKDKRIRKALKKYQKKLEEIEETIEMREKSSTIKYEFFAL